MDLSAPVTDTEATRPDANSPAPAARQPGPDVVRALAMMGVVVMNYHGYLVIRGARRDGGVFYDVFNPWTGPLSTRFAATFVLTAGVGVTLLTRSSLPDRDRTTQMRWRLIRRGLFLYAFGLLFDFVWNGTILPFYGAMFVIAAALFTLRSRWVAAVGALAALTGWGLNWWAYEQRIDGQEVGWLATSASRSPRQLLIDVFVNGTHPLLPWLAFFCTGIVVGRLLGATWWRPAAVGFGFVLFASGTIANSTASSDRALVVLSNDPFDRGIAYSSSALGTALIAFAVISAIADQFSASPIVDALRRAGQMSLTIYVTHALVFNLLIDWVDLVDPIDQRGIATALTFAVCYWLLATALAVAYHHRFGRGPAERLYRRLTA